MRTKSAIVLSLLLIFGLLVPSGAWADKKLTAFGSGALTTTGGAPLGATDLVGAVVTANPGLEKTITLHIPPYTFPVFVNKNEDKPDDDNNLDTIVILTNTSGGPLTFKLTLRDSGGTPITLKNGMTSQTFMMTANQTIVIFISDLLP